MPLVLLLILVMPLKRHPIWTDSGGNFTVTKYLGVACLVYALGYFLLRASRNYLPRYLATNQARWYLVFVVLIFTSFIRVRTLEMAYYILGPASLMILCFILLTVVDSLKRLRWVLLATVGSIGFASLYVIREWVKNHGWVTGSRGEWVVGDSNHFAVSAICAIPLAWYIAETLKSGWERWLCRACGLVAISAVVVGASRGGFLGLVAAMLFLAARSRKPIRNLATAVVLLIGFNFAYPRSSLERLLHPDVNDIGSEVAHRASWEAGVNMVRAHPLSGVGFAGFRPEMLKYAPDWYDGPPYMAHSAYVSVAAEMGIPGFVVFLVVLIATTISLERTYRMKAVPRLIKQAALALQGALLGSSISIAFISAEHHEFLWLIIFMSMCLPPLAARIQMSRMEMAAATESEPEPAAVLSPS